MSAKKREIYKKIQLNTLFPQKFYIFHPILVHINS